MVITSRGLRLECESEDDVITKSLRETGEWEEGVALAIDEHLQPDWTFLDIGAHIGVFAIQAAVKGANVIAIEANHLYANLLERNARLNQVEVEVHRCAVSNEDGDGFLRRDARFVGNPAASYLARIGDTHVEVCRLESVLGERRPEFIKLDIEGLEHRVLADNPELLAEAQVIIVEVGTEMCRRFEVMPIEVVDLLRSHGFGVTYIDGTPLDDRLTDMPADFYTNLLARKGYQEAAGSLVQKKVAPATALACVWRDIVPETVECLLQLSDRGWGIIVKRGDALITRSRSVAVSHWYQNTDEEVFLMFDDDVVFLPEHAEKVVQLARELKTVVCAAYPVKDGGHLACRRLPGQEIVFGKDSPPVEIIYPATGFMAVHRDVITAMVEAKKDDGSSLFHYCDATGGLGWWPLFDCFEIQHDNGKWEYLSEDYAFGEVARRLGFKTILDPSVILFHMGRYPYTIENMRNVKNIEVAK